MPIELPENIVVPPVQAKIADSLWILHMGVQAPSAQTPVSAEFTVAPFISSTGEILSDQAAIIRVPDVLEACATNSTLGTALQSIYASVLVLAKERSLFGLTPDPVE